MATQCETWGCFSPAVQEVYAPMEGYALGAWRCGKCLVECLATGWKAEPFILVKVSA